MPAAELPHRVREQLRIRVDAVRLPSLPTATLHLRPLVDEALHANLPSLTEAVQRIQSGPERLGIRYDSRVAFDTDPLTGRTWSTTQHGHASQRRLSNTDIKITWERTRLPWTPVLAAAGRLLDDTHARDATLSDLDAWLSRPLFMGLPWAAGIECAHRAASLLLTADLLGEALSVEHREALSRNLAGHYVWIARYPSLYSSENNHRIAELAALAVLARRLAITDPRPHLDALAETCDRLFHPDGGCAEQTPSYHARNLEWLLWALVEAGPHARLEAHVLGGARFLRACLDGTGRPPSWGDDDDSQIVPGPEPRADYEASILEVAGRYLSCADCLPPSPVRALRVAWLTPAEPTDTRPATVSSQSFAATGLTILRAATPRGTSVVQVDHGPLGHPPLFAHGHADALAVTWSIGTAAVLVDPGTYRYNGAPEWRRWMRSTAAHNTVCVAGRDQATQLTGFSWREPASSRVEAIDLAGGRVTASHDGYTDLGVRHRRQVTLTATDLTVQDWLEGDGKHSATWSFLVHPDVRVHEDRLLLPDGGEIRVHCSGPWRWETSESRPGPGVFSAAYGTFRSAPVLRIEATTPAEITLRFELLST